MNLRIKLLSVLSGCVMMGGTVFSAAGDSPSMVVVPEASPTAKAVRQIQLEKRGAMNVYVLDSRPLVRPVDFMWAYANSQKSKDLYNGGQALMVFGYIFAIPGGAVLGYSLASAAMTGQTSWLPIAGIGGGAALLGIIFGALADGSVKKSIENFNAEQKKISSLDGFRLQFGPMGLVASARF